MSAPSPATQALDDLSPTDRALLADHAPRAIAARGSTFFVARRALWTDWLLTGCVGLFGLIVLDWSATHAALLLFGMFWIGWLCDLAVWLLRSSALSISHRRTSDDMRFWQIVAILRGKRRQPPDARAHPTLGFSLCVDLIAGSVASVLLISGLFTAGVDVAAAASPSLLVSIAVIAIGGIGPGLRARFKRDADGSVPLPVFGVGQRGIGLVVLVFALMTAGGGALSAELLMGCAYAFFVVMGAIELTWGVPALNEEVEWVRENHGRQR